MKKIKYTAGDWCAIIGTLIAIMAFVGTISFYISYPFFHAKGLEMFKDYSWGNILFTVDIVYCIVCLIVIAEMAPCGCVSTTTTTYKTLWGTYSKTVERDSNGEETITREFDEEEIAEPVLRKGA
jgi:hypothetical protein